MRGGPAVAAAGASVGLAPAISSTSFWRMAAASWLGWSAGGTNAPGAVDHAIGVVEVEVRDAPGRVAGLTQHDRQAVHADEPCRRARRTHEYRDADTGCPYEDHDRDRHRSSARRQPLAAERDTTLRTIVETALRHYIEATSNPVDGRPRLRRRTFGGRGLQPGLSESDGAAIRERACGGRGG
jgi:hypothetical protein